MNNWMKMVSCDDRGFEGLHNELRNCGGSYIFDNVKMPESCNNAECTIEFRYYGEDKISLTCAQAPIPYTGNDGNIALWMENGIVEFESFEEMKGFLRCFKHDLPDNVNITPAPVVTNTPVDTNETSSEDKTIPVQPEMRYDRESLTVPETNKSYLVVDKDKLILNLNKEIFGQEENIKKIVHLVCNHLGTKGKTRPLSVFLYGPTGIGKSAIIEALVNEINSQIDRNNRYAYRPVDCTQFQDRADISRLTGAAPGYVGFDEPGVFSILEDNPNTVFVFEEIEKAASNATEVIMQAMETGKQETNGKTLKNGESFYDLSHCIIFFTSNICVEEKKKTLGFATTPVSVPAQNITRSDKRNNIARIIGEETKEAKLKLAETGKFRREVIGRMNAIIKFNPLTGDAVKDIAAKCIRDVASKSHRLYITEISTPVLQEFLNETAGEVESFGVRSLRSEAEYFFNDAFREYSHTHEDYSSIIVSGSLDDVIVSPANTEKVN